MQVAQPLTVQEDSLARQLTNVLRGEVRDSGQAPWWDLDVLLGSRRRFSHYTRAEAINVIRHSFHRSHFRFDFFFIPDASRDDGFRYHVQLRPHLHTNHHGH